MYLCFVMDALSNSDMAVETKEPTADEGIVESPVLHDARINEMEERLRRKLQFFFMNPIEKWEAKRRFPYKFVVQVIKIVLVTLQLCLFAHSRYTHVNYTWDNTVTFSHLFLRGWDITMEVNNYPPETGPLSVYMIDEFFKTIDYAAAGYANLPQAIGPYSFPTEDNTMAPMRLCLYRYKDGTIFGFNESYVFNPEIDTLCVDLYQNVTINGSQAYLHEKDIHINFSALVKAELTFSIKTVNFKAAGPITAPDCYRFDIMILFNNQDHDGQMVLRLEAEPTRLVCHGDVEFIKNSQIDDALRSFLYIYVVLSLFISVIMDAYDTIKKYYKDGFPQSDLRLFVGPISTKFLCSEVIAPIRSEVDDISLFIINFEDLSNPSNPEPIEQVKLSKFDKARASFRQSFRIGHIALRDRGLRLAGYLTPPSDATQDEDEIIAPKHQIESSPANKNTVLKVEANIWAPMSTPALTRTKELDCLPHDIDTLSGPGEIVITAPGITQTTRDESKEQSTKDMKAEFVQTKSLDFEAQFKHVESAKLIRCYENTHSQTSRGFVEKRAHTVDDFMRESDLQRYKTVPVKQAVAAQDARTSSSLSNVPSDSLKAKDNGSGKYFQGTRQTINMGEKVAQCMCIHF
uniref:Mucolipin extracytosolic domain-containing protein n=1 Tax=Anopheles christyi TaxID=43041 RepID=A0A182JTW3_9DIPT